MPNFQCPGCSAKLKLTDKHLGRKIKCPKCETVTLVPADLDLVDANLVESIDDLQLQADPFASNQQSSGPSQGYASNYSAPYHPASYAAPTAQRQKRTATKPAKREQASTASNVEWGQVGMGVLMMVGAIVWFVVGLAGGVIFFYPPILLILGLIAVVKGLLNL